MLTRSVVFAFCAFMTNSLAAETLRWGFSPTDPEPFVTLQENQLGPSITRSMGELVAGRLGWQVDFIEVPNNRLDRSLRGGRIDISCNTIPTWLHEPDRHRWSEPLFQDAHVVVTRTDRPKPETLTEMTGMRVGAGHDRHYPPDLIHAFRTGRLQRIDVRDAQTRLKMVAHDRLDASVERRKAMEFHLRQHPDSVLTMSSWTLSQLPLRCAAEQQHRESGKRAVKTLNRLAREKRIEALLAEFGLRAQE